MEGFSLYCRGMLNFTQAGRPKILPLKPDGMLGNLVVSHKGHFQTAGQFLLWRMDHINICNQTPQITRQTQLAHTPGLRSLPSIPQTNNRATHSFTHYFQKPILVFLPLYPDLPVIPTHPQITKRALASQFLRG